MSDEARDLGPIQGHELPRQDLTPAVPGRRTPSPTVGQVPARVWQEVRDARRADVPNSRPLPDWVRRLAWVLDDAVAVPGTDGRRVGVDGFLTLIPGLGDAAGLGLSMIVVLAGVGAGVTVPTTLRMLLNVAFESAVGLIPFAGALFDMVFKANQRNVRLIEADLADRRGTRRSSIAVLVLAVLASVVGLVMMFVVATLSVALFAWLIYVIVT